MSMTKKFACLLMALTLAAAAHAQEGWFESGPASEANASVQSQPAQVAQQAPATTPVDRKYHFLFFFREQNPQTDAMWQVFQNAMGQAGDRAEWKAVNLLDPNSQPFVQSFNLGNPVTPLVLSVAPNGAVMGVFAQQFSEDQLLGSFGTPGQEAVQKIMIQGKMALLCFQNDSTQFNQEALAGVQSLLADPRFSPYAEAIKIDPRNPLEAAFLRQVGIDPSTPTAMTVLMTPPGVPVSTYNGGTTKEMFVTELTMEGGCGPNCKCLDAIPSGGDSKPVLSQFFGKIAGKFRNAG